MAGQWPGKARMDEARLRFTSEKETAVQVVQNTAEDQPG